MTSFLPSEGMLIIWLKLLFGWHMVPQCSHVGSFLLVLLFLFFSSPSPWKSKGLHTVKLVLDYCFRLWQTHWAGRFMSLHNCYQLVIVKSVYFHYFNPIIAMNEKELGTSCRCTSEFVMLPISIMENWGGGACSNLIKLKKITLVQDLCSALVDATISKRHPLKKNCH